MRKRMLILPLLAAMYAGACFQPACDGTPSTVHSQRERDVRFAIIAFALSCSILLSLNESIYQSNKD